MSNETAETPVIIKAIPQKFTEIANKMSAQGLITEICDAIFADIDSLCQLAKSEGENAVYRVKKATVSSRSDEPLKGMYVGLGLGRNWIEIGFLEKVIIEAIVDRLKKSSVQCNKEGSYSVDNMTGGVTVENTVYKTSNGYYQLCHTYAWFLTKRVD